MTVRESGEMYLEAILVLAKKSGYVRSIDVSEYLGYSKPSVSRAMGILREGGYILMEKDGAITLTDSGKKLAETIYERHTVLSELLIRLGVDEKTATDDACRIEHVISDESFQAIKQFLDLCLRHVADGLVHDLAVFHDHQRGDAGDAEFHGKLHFLVHVDLAHGDILPLLSDLLHNGADHPARAAPWRPEIQQHGLIAVFHQLVVVGLRNVHDGHNNSSLVFFCAYSIP